MKKWPLFLALYFCACLLAACAAGGGAPVPGGTPSEEPQAGGETAQPAAAVMTCRVVDEDDGMLVLAEQDGGRGDVYTLTVENQDIEAGSLVEVAYDGTILESYPAQFGGDAKLTVLEDGFDDRCALYLDVLNDLWEVDSGLNDSGMEYVGVDLSATSLPESERSAVAWAFAGEHGVSPVEGTFEELVDAGYITASPLLIDRSDTEPAEPTHYFYEWKDGCLFSIEEKETKGIFSLNTVTFDAQKWRSGLGAYFFSDCTAVQSAGGHWGEYTVGSEAIS